MIMVEGIRLDIPNDITLTKKVLYEDDKIKVSTTGQNYDFVATIENKTNTILYFVPNGDEAEDCWVKFYIEPNDWAGLLGNLEGYLILNALANNRFYYVDQEKYMED